jgi:regulator of protease activity HflC (stomatin/prohibitin superfamily)
MKVIFNDLNTPSDYDLGMLALIVISGVIIAGIIIFLLSCIFYVKKNHVIIIEKMQKYHGTYSHGFHWFWPFIYHRVGYYALVPLKRIIRLNNGRKASIEYQIIDPLKFHYVHSSIESFINKMSLEESEINFEIIKKNLAAIGIDFINIKAVD